MAVAHEDTFREAVELAHAMPGLSVGCHVVLVDGRPVSPPGAVDTLLAIRSGEPECFYSSLSAFAARATMGGFDREQLVTEIVAQIRKIQAAGIAADASGLAQARAHFSGDIEGDAAGGANLRSARDSESVCSDEGDYGAAVRRTGGAVEAVWAGPSIECVCGEFPAADFAGGIAGAGWRDWRNRDGFDGWDFAATGIGGIARGNVGISMPSGICGC